VLQLDELERHYHTNALITGMARAAGAEGAQLPGWPKIRAEFDELLAAAPAPVDDRDSTLLQALGLR
jgi:predicted RNA polymerase sigma factor